MTLDSIRWLGSGRPVKDRSYGKSIAMRGGFVRLVAEMLTILGAGLLVSLPLGAAVVASSGSGATEKPFTVVSFGDSTTAARPGVDVYTDQLARRFPGMHFLNRGVPGNHTEDARLRFERDVVAAHPDLVIIQFGMNDSMIDVWKKPPATAPRVTLADYERNLTRFVTDVRATGASVILMTPNPRRWSPVLRNLYAKPPYDPASEKGLLYLMEDYVNAVRRIAHDLRVPLVDVYALYEQFEKTTGKSCSELMLDGHHPNTAGQKLVADALEPEVGKALREGRK